MSRYYELETVSNWLCEVFLHAGLKPRDATILCEQLLLAECRGVHSHGLLLTRVYYDRIRAGGIRANYELAVVERNGPVLVLDGGGGPGQSLALDAMERTIDTGRKYPIAMTVLRNSNHIGMLASYALRAVNQNFIAIILTNTGPSICAFGGEGRQLGNNAICIAAPSDSGAHFVLDIATGEVACGKVRYAAINGTSLVEDSFRVLGSSSCLPSEFDNGGYVPPFGGHKGYGLCLAVDVLTGILADSLTSFDVKGQRRHLECPTGCSQTFLVINGASVSSFSKIASNLMHFLERVRELSPTDPDQPILIPGDLEREFEKETKKKGILIPVALIDELNKIATELGVNLISESKEAYHQ